MTSSITLEPSDELGDLLLVTQHADSDSSLAESVSSLSSETFLQSVRLRSGAELIRSDSPSITASTVTELTDRSTSSSEYSDTFETLSTDHSIYTDERSGADSSYTYSDDFTGSHTLSVPSVTSLMTKDEQHMRDLFVRRKLRQLQASMDRRAAQTPQADPEQIRFCSRMVRNLKKKVSGDVITTRPSSSARAAPPLTAPPLAPPPRELREAPQSFADRIKIACLRSNMKAELQKEESSNVLYVRRKLEERIAEREFLHRSSELARSRMIERQLNDPCYQNPILMYADLLNSLPNPRQAHGDIWRQLLEPLRRREASAKTDKTSGKSEGAS